MNMFLQQIKSTGVMILIEAVLAAVIVGYIYKRMHEKKYHKYEA